MRLREARLNRHTLSPDDRMTAGRIRRRETGQVSAGWQRVSDGPVGEAETGISLLTSAARPDSRPAGDGW